MSMAELQAYADERNLTRDHTGRNMFLAMLSAADGDLFAVLDKIESSSPEPARKTRPSYAPTRTRPPTRAHPSVQ